MFVRFLQVEQINSFGLFWASAFTRVLGESRLYSSSSKKVKIQYSCLFSTVFMSNQKINCWHVFWSTNLSCTWFQRLRFELSIMLLLQVFVSEFPKVVSLMQLFCHALSVHVAKGRVQSVRRLSAATSTVLLRSTVFLGGIM